VSEGGGFSSTLPLVSFCTSVFSSDICSFDSFTIQSVRIKTSTFHQKPLRTSKRKKSWVFKYGYRVAMLRDPARTYWICKHCHQHRVYSFKPLEVTKSTTAAITHIGLSVVFLGGTLGASSAFLELLEASRTQHHQTYINSTRA
jgi:hypothetical protein